MNSKSPLLAVSAACVLLGLGPLAFAETAKRTEPANSAEKTQAEEESGEIRGSWTSGTPAPREAETPAERTAEEQVVDNLDTVDADATSPSSDQAQKAQNAPRNASDRCLVSVVEAVLADRAIRDSGLSIDAQDGVVSLTGTLADQASIDHVRKVVEGIKGVNRVETQLKATRVATSNTEAGPQ